MVGATAFTYDTNGNMLTGLGGRVMAYDAENRPLSVSYAGKKTCYTYGVDGARLKKAENLATTVACSGLAATVPATVYFGPVEIRNFKIAGSEQVLTYPHPNVRLTNGKLPANASYLDKDGLGSVRVITDASGVKVESDSYKPFGEQSETLTAGLAVQETKGFIGERYDADAGLQYLNARYYDPVLGMFMQADWFDVLKAGVGTNRYSYSFNDPVNKLDPTGNDFFQSIVDFFSGASTTKADASNWIADNQRNIDDTIEAYENSRIDAVTAQDRLSFYDEIAAAQYGRFGRADSPLYEGGMVLLNTAELALLYTGTRGPGAAAGAGLTIKAESLVGRYGDVGGHHIHQSAAFRGVGEYSRNNALSVSDSALEAAGSLRPHIGADSVTSFQRALQNELAVSGRANSMSEQTRIAAKTLEYAGVPPSLARELAFRSEIDLVARGVTAPTGIPYARN